MDMIFDTHAHYDDEAFDLDREPLLRSLAENGIGWVVDVGASLRSSRSAAALAGKYPFIYAAVGVHPSETMELEGWPIAAGGDGRQEDVGDGGDSGQEDIESDGDSGQEDTGNDGGGRQEYAGENESRAEKDPLAVIRALAMEKKTVAIGEIGLDYHWDEPGRDIQKKWFIKQLDLAGRLGLPVIIHSRDAAQDTLDIMKAEHHSLTGGVIHCFSYGIEIAREYLDMGYYLGIGGVLTYKNARKLKEVVEYAPLSALVLETDCPYLAPAPYRGSRNSSLYLPEVVKALAGIKKTTAEEVVRVTAENAMRLYNCASA